MCQRPAHTPRDVLSKCLECCVAVLAFAKLAQYHAGGVWHHSGVQAGRQVLL